MKPRNKRERAVCRIDRQLPRLSKAQKDWATEHVLDHRAYKSKSGKINCLSCGHSWKTGLTQDWQEQILYGEKAKHEDSKCPNCKRNIMLYNSMKRTYDEYAYMCIVQKFKGYQVIRNVRISGTFKIGKKLEMNAWETSRIYIDENGYHYIIGQYIGSYYASNWQGDFVLRHPQQIEKHAFKPYKYYPRMSFIDKLIRNGFKKELILDIHPYHLSNALLKSSKAETLMKSKQYYLLHDFCYSYSGEENIKRYWNQIKICIRNNYLVKKASDWFDYLVKKASDWFDYLDLLGFYNKDIHNAKYICPFNLKQEHDRYVERRRRDRIRQDRIAQKAKMAENQKAYIKAKKKYFKLEFIEDDLRISVLTHVRLFYKYGDYFNHCIGSNSYFKKADSLMFIAYYKGKPQETVQYSLTQNRVIQSRGKNNNPSKHHKKIVALLNNKSNIIKKTEYPRVKKKIKQLKSA